MPTNETDVMRQIQAFFSTKGLPVSSYSDSHPPTKETAILVKRVTWKKDCPHLQDSCYNFNLLACILYYTTRLQSRRAAARRAPARGSEARISRLNWGALNCTNGKQPRYLIIILPKLERWRHNFFSVPAYSLLEQSLGRFQM